MKQTKGDQPKFGPILSASVVLLWLILVGAGMFFSLAQYANRPGDAGQPSSRWPLQSRLRHNAHRPTLVMFAHPRCPCTRASIGELAVLMTQAGGKLDAKVCFLQPEGAGLDWSETDLWFEAAKIPNVQVFTDKAGVEVRRFGTATSGQVLLYDSDGELLFHGGITSARGHSGDNFGRSSVVSLINNARRPNSSLTYAETPVFGCQLLD